MKTWCLEVWGDFACFTRPEMKVERVSYDVPTPSSARGIFEAILWKPAIRWHVLKIDVLEPICWTNVRRNEVGKVCTKPGAARMAGRDDKPMGLFIEVERQQRASLLLRNVRYRLYATFELLPADQGASNPLADRALCADSDEEHTHGRGPENEGKYAAMFERRARKGQCFHRPYLGCREFACHFRLVAADEDAAKPIEETRDLGWMLYDMDYSNPRQPVPVFFRAQLDNGSVITQREKVEVRA